MIDAFRRIVGKQDVFEARADDPAEAILGVKPRFAVRPRSAEEVAAVLALAGERQVAVAPWGGGRHQDRGVVPTAADVVLLTGQLAGITQFDAADQTMSVKAGTRLADIATAAREHRLWLPLDPPGFERATIGGVVAAAVAGPLRTGFGLPVDHVLGSVSAHSDGKLAHSGGRLVKNVTGFDIHRLLHGSQGGLAVLTELHLRLRPLPERQAAIAVTFGDAESLDRFLLALRESGAAPVAHVVLDVESARAAELPIDLGHKDGVYVALLRFFDVAKTVDRMLACVRAATASTAALQVQAIDGPMESTTFERVREWTARSARDGAPQPVVLKLATLPMRAGASALGGLVEAALAACAGTGAACSLLLEPELGLVRFVFASEPARPTLDALSAFAQRDPSRVRFTIESGPARFRATHAADLGRPVSLALQRRLKAATDPAGVLLPGRLEGANA